MILSIWIIVSAIGLIVFTIKQIQFLLHLKLLEKIKVPTEFVWPSVKLVVTACNEEKTIQKALNSLLKIKYPKLQIVVVNDRSSDLTGKFIQETISQHPQIQYLEVNALPAGWLGKVHAQGKAIEKIDADWILFTDADVHFSKLAIHKAIYYAETNNKDFLTLVPHIYANNLGIKLCMVQFLLTGTFGINIRRIQNQQYLDAVGCGAFNLVRTTAYQKSKGIKWLKMEVIDDAGFGFMMKLSGANCDVLSGLNEVGLEWYPDMGAYFKGMEKNSFSVFQYNPWFVTLFTVLILLWLSGIYIVPFFSSTNVSIILLMVSALVYLSANALVIRKISLYSAWNVLALPMALLIGVLVVWRSLWLCIKQKGIYWRNTFYSLSELKEEQRLRLMDFILFKKFPK